MPKSAAPKYNWLEKMNLSQLVYASKRLGIVHTGLDRSGVVAAIRAHDRRAELKESDVKHKRLTWDELQRKIDWVSCGWASDWERRAKYSKVPYREVSYLLTDSAATSRMLFVSGVLGYRWANMPSVTRERRRIG